MSWPQVLLEETNDIMAEGGRVQLPEATEEMEVCYVYAQLSKWQVEATQTREASAHSARDEHGPRDQLGFRRL